jgi:hypothetical protein
MHKQIIRRFEQKLSVTRRQWEDRRAFGAEDTDSNTFIFADLCAAAIGAARALRLRGSEARGLALYLEERAKTLGGDIDTDEALDALGQLWNGASLFDIRWRGKQAGNAGGSGGEAGS